MAGPVDLVLIRGLLPDLTLRPGAVLNARVVDAKTLVLEGVRLTAQLPDGVQAGQRLRLRVESVPTQPGSDRLHLRVLERADPAAAPAAPETLMQSSAYQLALPGGAVARIHVQEREAPTRGARTGAARSVVVRYDSPTLGRLDVRLDAVAAAVHVSAGSPADTVAGAAGVLREALARVTGRPIQVTVHPREETLDVRA